MRDLLIRAQSWLAHLGHSVGPDDGIGHGRVYTPDSPALPDGMKELGWVEQLHLREPGEATATVLRFAQAELRAFLTPDPTKNGRKILQLVGRVGREVLMHCGVSKDVQATPPPWMLGPIHRLVYHQGPPQAETKWEHAFGYEFGSDGSEIPILFYDPHEQRVIVLGGVYWVGIKQGIVC